MRTPESQVIEMLSLELTESDHVVQDLLMSLRTDLGDLTDNVDQIDLRKVVDRVAQELATSRHARVSVRGDAAVRADADVATPRTQSNATFSSMPVSSSARDTCSGSPNTSSP